MTRDVVEHGSANFGRHVLLRVIEPALSRDETQSADVSEVIEERIPRFDSVYHVTYGMSETDITVFW
jgi:hypothetical protein